MKKDIQPTFSLINNGFELDADSYDSNAYYQPKTYHHLKENLTAGSIYYIVVYLFSRKNMNFTVKYNVDYKLTVGMHD